MKYIYKSNDGLLTLKIGVEQVCDNKYHLSVISIKSFFSENEYFFREYNLGDSVLDNCFIRMCFAGGDYIWSESVNTPDDYEFGIHIWIDSDPDTRNKCLSDFDAEISGEIYSIIKQSFKPLFNSKQIEII